METAALYKHYLLHPIIATDTRKIEQGSLFFALKGDNFDGHAFVQKSLENGASLAVIDNPAFAIEGKTLLVDNVLTALQELSKHHRQQFDIPFLAITGSNGKTTTKELIQAVVEKNRKSYCTFGNLNNHIGVPLTILKIKKDAAFAIIEMGANHQKEIASYCEWALPTHVLINNCGKAHLEGFGGIEGVRKGKGELYDYAAKNDCIVFRNNDLDYLMEMTGERNISKENIITYGSANADFIGKAIDNNGILEVAILNARLEVLIKTQLVGDYNFGNVMAAVTIGRYLDIDIDSIKNAIEEYTPSNSRSQLIEKNSNTYILDAYNANPTSMLAAIKNFENTSFSEKVLLLGSMKELGMDTAREHQEIIDTINEGTWKKIVLVGSEFGSTQHNFIHFDSSMQVSDWLKEQEFEHTAFLVKGSRGSNMEKCLEGIV
jgi:UDP-N-acetylmuramoyl-tripeptide--D-alanyl-D-alanine ligase